MGCINYYDYLYILSRIRFENFSLIYLFTLLSKCSHDFYMRYYFGGDFLLLFLRGIFENTSETNKETFSLKGDIR